MFWQGLVLFLYFLVSMMDNILYITIFLVCILICSGVSCILYKYQGTISPVNQNVITKLSSFCVQLITPVVYIEVHHAFHQAFGGWCSIFQGISVICKTAFGPLDYLTALGLRQLLYSVVMVFCGIGNVITVLRLLIVLQVWSCDHMCRLALGASTNLHIYFRMKKFQMRIQKNCLKTFYSWSYLLQYPFQSLFSRIV